MTAEKTLSRGRLISNTAFFYYIAFAVHCFRATLARTTFTSFLFINVETFDLFLQVIICLLILIALLDVRYSFTTWILFLILVLLSVYVWVNTGEALLF